MGLVSEALEARQEWREARDAAQAVVRAVRAARRDGVVTEEERRAVRELGAAFLGELAEALDASAEVVREVREAGARALSLLG